MFGQQGELPLFEQLSPGTKSSVTNHSFPKITEPNCLKYYTTEEVVRALRPPNPRPLYQARRAGKAYRKDNQIAVPVGIRNKWEIFRSRA
jgi:hypothetical protein